MATIQVRKASGEFQTFSVNKLKKFLRRIQVPEDAIKQIANKTIAHFTGECSTSEIIEHVNSQLKNIEKGSLYAARYNIKPAIRKLGPGGHIFEQYIGRIFELEGYKVQVSVEIKGKCILHEIDVLAQLEHQQNLIECKFHNKEGTKSDVGVMMYTYARYLDIKESPINKPYSDDFYVWLVTNTKPTTAATKYAKCMNMHILTVEQPYGDSLIEKVIKQNVFPITSIDALDEHLEPLFQANHVLLEDVLILTSKEVANYGISEKTWLRAQIEAKRILQP